MRRLCGFLFIGLFLALPVQATETLTFLTWEDYIDPELVSEFEQKNDVKIRFVYFEDDDEREMILAQTNGIGFDLVLLDSALVQNYIRQGWLEPLDRQRISNAAHIRMPWNRAPLPDTFYEVPYFWGTVGILYRKDRVNPPPTSWKAFFQPAEPHRHRILSLNTVSTVYAMALKALGRSMVDVTEQDIQAATSLLAFFAPYVTAWRNPTLKTDNEFSRGEIDMAMAYNGDALQLIDKDESGQLAFVVPEEGTGLWMDSLAILKSSQKKVLAERFIQFLNEPEINARNAQTLYYATPNTAAEALLPADFRANPAVFPPEAIRARSEVFTVWPVAINRLASQKFVELTFR
ncbi:spermidine/putrescine ABC transporter substrate-binding protein [Hahella sp. SMD15-11]|uniref:Spermidine/putrescine ABC transporter substrate-binding protein n=1 Tax=Thermohahella caldifontis TaxID=3142973 RepID=A0AB39USY8_9GAMM